MCEVQDEKQFMTKKPSIGITTGRKCMKCQENAQVLIRIDDAFCRACFINYITHKFRSAIGKGRLILFDEKVLLAYSGGHSSCAMLHLVQQGFLEHVHKKLRFIPHLVHIDEGAVTNQTLDVRTAQRRQMSSKLQDSAIPFNIVSFEKVMDLSEGVSLINEPVDLQTINDKESISKEVKDNESISESHQSDPKASAPPECVCTKDLTNGMSSLNINDLAEKLSNLVNSAKTLTTKEDIVWRLRHQLLIEIAKQKGCTKIMLADSGTLVSIRILANVAQGRGAALPLDTGFIDGRHSDTSFIRPLKEFTKKEIVLYNNFHNLESIFIPSLTTMAGTGASINILTEEFVNGLQENFPSTVSTICRTGEKLGTNCCSTQKCILCKASLDTSVPQASALNATTFSLSLSKACKDKMSSIQPSLDEKQCCGGGDGSCQSTKMNRISMADMEGLICYGCRVTMRDVNDLSRLPSNLLSEVEKNIRRSKMKEEIEEFLLPGV